MKVSHILNRAKNKAFDKGLTISKDSTPVIVELPHLLGSNDKRSFEVIIREVIMEEDNEKTNSKEVTEAERRKPGIYPYC